jgi:glycosyltransferase involved in cell wall biosynthesis
VGDAVRAPVSAMIFTLDEEIHLPSCLASLAWTDDVIVVDSLSRDRTEAISRAAGARFFQNAFRGFGTQRMWALENTRPKYEWVLILDADERVTPELAEELARVVPAAPATVAAYRLKRRFHMWGRWLRHSSLYPSWVVRLVRRGRVTYVDRGHAETQVVDGETRDLEHDLLDENLKGMEEWHARQARYADKDARFEIEEERRPLGLGGLAGGDPLERRAAMKRLSMRAPLRPLLYFVYAYVLRGGFLDGAAGLRFCLLKSRYQAMVVRRKRALRREQPA